MEEVRLRAARDRYRENTRKWGRTLEEYGIAEYSCWHTDSYRACGFTVPCESVDDFLLPGGGVETVFTAFAAEDPGHGGWRMSAILDARFVNGAGGARFRIGRLPDGGHKSPLRGRRFAIVTDSVRRLRVALPESVEKIGIRVARGSVPFVQVALESRDPVSDSQIEEILIRNGWTVSIPPWIVDFPRVTGDKETAEPWRAQVSIYLGP